MDGFMKSLVVGLLIRLGVILYGEWQDSHLEVPFTDIDYKVFSDAARHVYEGGSPYNRHTYRYPPILAWILVPNVLFPTWGKILFSMIDLLTSIIIKKLMKFQRFSDSTCLKSAQVWIFNPLSIIISTRGNSDAIISATVLISSYFLLKQKPFLAGIFLALSIHIRLYPIIFSLAMYLALKDEENSSTSFSQIILNSLKKLYPNKSQIILVTSCITTLLILTVSCYWLYGFEFVNESILYHLTRKDTRHNFSVYFYLLYLQPDQQTYLLFMPQVVLLLIFSLVLGNKPNLLFCLFVQAFTFVSFNSVLTAQYFIWYLSLLTPNLANFNLNYFEASKLVFVWLFSQLAWLVPAYLLEFKGRNTFLFIWFQGIGFFCANLSVLVKLLKTYKKRKSDIKSLNSLKND